SSDPLEERRRAGYDVVDVEAEPLEHGRAGRRGAEPLERDRVATVADPLLPAERDARLDGEARTYVRRQHLVSVVGLLQLEELPARHRHDPDVRPVLAGDPAAGLERERDLRSGCDQDQVGRAALPERVRAALETGRG